MFVIMQVGSYISELLYRHECVVIPGYGALLSRRVPAQHFASSHTIYPPKKGLGFNAQITQNDGLLANHIASVKNIGFDQAVQEIRDYVRFLDQEIEEHGSVTIHKVGRFTRNNEQALQFTPMYLVNYLPEAFGLSLHETYAIDRLPSSQTQTATAIENDVLEQQADSPVVTLETPATRSSAWIRVAAVGAVLLGIGYLGVNSYQKQQLDQQVAVEKMAQEQLQSRIQESSFLINTPLPSVEIEVSPLIKNYHIVAGAFRDPANADKRVRQLQRQGYDARRIGVNRYGLHNVAFSSFVERHDAINELNKLRQLGFSQAWLFTGQLPQK
ncbi:HU domain-containing protein [Nonlabens xiamenensis]|uniref:HU domain-containing protein n=1 Tax=Nonlabens xiamenensis TaxID=2341043 RepID=UPI001F0C7C0D|nr:SPOR domain-containing protein [Nonlabens xiamenensis]